jgi:REP element-mobilizing transposase RayT
MWFSWFIDNERIVVDTIKQWAHIKGIEIIQGHAMPDRIHLFVSIPPKYSVAHTIGLLKGKSASEVMSFGTKSSRSPSDETAETEISLMNPSIERQCSQFGS